MTVNRVLFRAIIVVVVFFVFEGIAQAILLTEYDKMNKSEQASAISSVLKAYYNHYANSPETAYKAKCMTELYKPVVEGGGPQLLNLILDQLDLARATPKPSYTLEGVVEAVINRECKAP